MRCNDILGDVQGEVSGSHCPKLNTLGGLELDANQAEPENLAWLVPGPRHCQKNFKKSTLLVCLFTCSNGQPGVSTYHREKGGFIIYTIRDPVVDNCSM